MENKSQKGGKFYHAIKHLVLDKGVPRKTKATMFPIAIFAAETWAVMEKS